MSLPANNRSVDFACRMGMSSRCDIARPDAASVVKYSAHNYRLSCHILLALHCAAFGGCISCSNALSYRRS
jgi:hypothetical protein